MSNLVPSLSAAAVGLGNLRFFRPPLPGERMVWHSWQDMQQCLALPRDLRREFLAKLRKEWGKDTRAVMTDAGPTTLAPHWMAQGLLGSMIEMRQVLPEIEHQYVAGMMEATRLYHSEMDLTPLQSVNYSLRAFRNENGIPGPHPDLKVLGGDDASDR